MRRQIFDCRPLDRTSYAKLARVPRIECAGFHYYRAVPWRASTGTPASRETRTARDFALTGPGSAARQWFTTKDPSQR